MAKSFLKNPTVRDAVCVSPAASREASSLTLLALAGPLRKLLCWVPVGVFVTRHGYSMATVTGASMQARPPEGRGGWAELTGPRDSRHSTQSTPRLRCTTTLSSSIGGQSHSIYTGEVM